MTGACPKCGHPQAQPAESCQRCGVIFSRIHREGPGADTNMPAPSADPRVKEFRGLVGQLLAAKQGEQGALIAVKAVFLIGLALWGARLASQPIVSNAVGESFLHLINLPFHEAGHIFFTPFGRFIQILGGTLGQLIIPIIVTVTFIYQQQPYSASIGLWWLGESFLDIAPYIDDARAGQLMLLGGVTGSEVEDYHDWEGILSRLGMMQYDHALARAAFSLGMLIMLTAFCWGGCILWREYILRDRQAL
jgi:hypothetical protein